MVATRPRFKQSLHSTKLINGRSSSQNKSPHTRGASPKLHPTSELVEALAVINLKKSTRLIGSKNWSRLIDVLLHQGNNNMAEATLHKRPNLGLTLALKRIHGQTPVLKTHGLPVVSSSINSVLLNSMMVMPREELKNHGPLSVNRVTTLQEIIGHLDISLNKKPQNSNRDIISKLKVTVMDMLRLNKESTELARSTVIKDLNPVVAFPSDLSMH